MNIEWPEINCSLGDPLPLQTFSCIPAESQWKSLRQDREKSLDRRWWTSPPRDIRQENVLVSLTPADLEIFSSNRQFVHTGEKEPLL